MDFLSARRDAKTGFWCAFACYSFWGTFPVYWYPLNQSAMSAQQIMAHRVLWSAVFALLLLLVFRQGARLAAVVKRPKMLAVFVLSALLIGGNWLVYLWAINHHHVLDASLGYFVGPLFNILLGCLFLRERLNALQITAMLLALAGIVWLAWPAGQIPWVSLLLASSFGFYSLVRKLAPMDALPTIALETLILLPLALAYLLWCALNGSLTDLGSLNTLQTAVLLGSGAATTLPLLLFTFGAQRISLSLLGILQYLSPTLQLIWGVWLFDEHISAERLTGYLLVWAGVAVFLYGAWRHARKQAA